MASLLLLRSHYLLLRGMHQIHPVLKPQQSLHPLQLQLQEAEVVAHVAHG